MYHTRHKGHITKQVTNGETCYFIMETSLESELTKENTTFNFLNNFSSFLLIKMINRIIIGLITFNKFCFETIVYLTIYII